MLGNLGKMVNDMSFRLEKVLKKTVYLKITKYFSHLRLVTAVFQREVCIHTCL